MKEVFKDIPNYEGIYQVSNLGVVKRLERKVNCRGGNTRLIKEKIRKPSKNHNGYLYVGLTNDNKIKVFKIHQLVAMAFLNHKPCGHKIVVDHIDNDKTNNKLSNLQLITHRENVSKDRRGGTSKYTGVCWHKGCDKWQASITTNGKFKYLGLFDSEHKAYEAYCREINKAKEVNNG